MPKISKYAYQIFFLHQELTDNVSHIKMTSTEKGCHFLES